MSSYDEVPYRSFPFRQSHPDRLATIGTLFGLDVPPVAKARILELGCASGGNLIPIAEQFPDSTCLGLDASERQVADGQRVVRQTGLTNLELRCQDILSFTGEGPFDYIISHGVYSWVPDGVQERILAIIQEQLAPSGIAYVSYNTFPGWHMRGMIRDVMRYRAKSFERPQEKLEQARGLLTFLSNSVKSENSAYSLLLRSELEAVSRADDSYLLHEHLEDINEPIYFHEFAERAEKHGLQYLGEADYGAMCLDGFPEPVQQMLQGVSRSLIEREQYMDFLRNRAFRQTLLCRSGFVLERAALPGKLLNLRVASNAQAEGATGDLASRDPVTYRRRSSVLTTSEPIVKAAMRHLGEVWPMSVPFSELAARARSAVAGGPVAVDAGMMSSVTSQLAGTILRCFGTAVVDLHVAEPRFALRVGERPSASSLARVQAEFQPTATNQLHENVPLDDIHRKVLLACDGTHSLAEISVSLQNAVLQGEVMLFDRDGRRIQEPAEVSAFCETITPRVLESLARCALLVT